MQFRTEFGFYGWSRVATGMAFFAAWLFKSTQPTSALVFASLWIALALLQALKVRFFYWEMDSSCLRRRRLWEKTEIPWQDVLSVQTVLPIGSAEGRLIVYYKDPEPMTYRTNVIVYSQDRPAFLDALQGFAPQAKLEA